MSNLSVNFGHALRGNKKGYCDIRCKTTVQTIAVAADLIKGTMTYSMLYMLG